MNKEKSFLNSSFSYIWKNFSYDRFAIMSAFTLNGNLKSEIKKFGLDYTTINAIFEDNFRDQNHYYYKNFLLIKSVDNQELSDFLHFRDFMLNLCKKYDEDILIINGLNNGITIFKPSSHVLMDEFNSDKIMSFISDEIKNFNKLMGFKYGYPRTNNIHSKYDSLENKIDTKEDINLNSWIKKINNNISV